MIEEPHSPPTSDICLLLRAHAEQRWLSHEVVPVLRQLERRDGLPEEQLGAALAYLEVLWIEASQRAAETDAAYAQLRASRPPAGAPLHVKARSYHGAVLHLREAIARHVAQLVAVPQDEHVLEGASCRDGDRIPSPPRATASLRSAVTLNALRRGSPGR